MDPFEKYPSKKDQVNHSSSIFSTTENLSDAATIPSDIRIHGSDLPIRSPPADMDPKCISKDKLKNPLSSDRNDCTPSSFCMPKSFGTRTTWLGRGSISDSINMMGFEKAQQKISSSTAHSTSGTNKTTSVEPKSALLLKACLSTPSFPENHVISPLCMASFSEANQKPEELQLKIRQLENEVALLERELAEKTLSTGKYIKDLATIRNELAQERSTLSFLEQKFRKNLSAALEYAQKMHIEQCHEFQGLIETLRRDKKSLQRRLDKTEMLLIASQLESSTLTEQLSSLSSELEVDRTSFSKSIHLLELQVHSGCERIAKLNHALGTSHQELVDQGTLMEKSTLQYVSKIKQYQEQVDILSNNLLQVQDQLLSKTSLVESLQAQLAQVHCQENKTLRDLKQNAALYQSLSAKFQEFSIVHQKTLAELNVIKEEKKKVTLKMKQEQLKNGELELKVNHTEKLLQQESAKRKQGDDITKTLRKDIELLEVKCDDLKRKERSREVEVKKFKEEMTKMQSHLQQELAGRAQQVMEIDGCLRTFQAEKAASHLHLERTLTQRQAELRGRTQEMEELVVKLQEAKERENQLLREIYIVKQKLLE